MNVAAAAEELRVDHADLQSSGVVRFCPVRNLEQLFNCGIKVAANAQTRLFSAGEGIQAFAARKTLKAKPINLNSRITKGLLNLGTDSCPT